MTRPDLTVIIPSKGRLSLSETLESIPREKWIEILVVADGMRAHRKVEPIVEQAKRGRQLRLYRCGPSAVGHPQRTYGMGKARGRFLSFMDDDDVYTPQAWAAFRGAIHYTPETLWIFRMAYEGTGTILWSDRVVRHGNVGSPMVLVPNNPDGLGVWERRRSGDFDFIRDTAAKHPLLHWSETIVAEIRVRD